MIRFKLIILAAALVGATTGCQALQGPNPAFVQAERATYNAVVPDHTNYINNDPNLQPDEKARRLRTLEVWDRTIAEQEKGVKPDANP